MSNKQQSKHKKSPHELTFAPVDGGADTCLLGQEFHIDQTYPHRTVDVMGYSNDLVTSGVPIGSGTTLYEGPDGTQFLLQVHEGIIIVNRYSYSYSHSMLGQDYLLLRDLFIYLFIGYLGEETTQVNI